MKKVTDILLIVVLLPLVGIGALLVIFAVALGIFILSPFVLILGIIKLVEMACGLVRQLFNKPNKQ